MKPTNDLGAIITSATVRKTIYGAYVILLVAVGAVQAALLSIGASQPDWLTAAQAALVFLGIPIAGLAAANSGVRKTDETPNS